MTTKQRVGYTPGAWGIYNEPDLIGQVAIREVNNPNHGRILAVVDSSDEQDEANASLIASAPELLSACERAYKHRFDELMTHDEASYDVEHDELLKQLEQAIAKAKGEV